MAVRSWRSDIAMLPPAATDNATVADVALLDGVVAEARRPRGDPPGGGQREPQFYRGRGSQW